MCHLSAARFVQVAEIQLLEGPASVQVRMILSDGTHHCESILATQQIQLVFDQVSVSAQPLCKPDAL